MSTLTREKIVLMIFVTSVFVSQLVRTEDDDYHSNINLSDMIQDYTFVRGRNDKIQQQPLQWSNNMKRIPGRLLSRAPFAPANSLNDDETDHDGQVPALALKLRPQSMGHEFKDYASRLASAKQSQVLPSQETAAKARVLANDLIGELLQARQKQRVQQKRYRMLPSQLSQQTLVGDLLHQVEETSSSNEINTNGHAMTANREKRRRCKSDPNLSVKNPSFCDTDAYFGAADYSMRDVWDTAGR